MHYELWGLNPANRIAVLETEAAAAQLVRELLASGWSVEDLSLGIEPDAGDDPDRSTLPVWEGPELERLVRAVA